MAQEQKPGLGRPKRGDVKKAIFREIVPLFKKMELKDLESLANVSEREFVQTALVNVEEACSSSTQRKAMAHTAMAKEPAPESHSAEVAANHGSVSSASATSSLDAVNAFLKEAPHPSKKEAMAKIWEKMRKNLFRISNKKQEQKPEQKQNELSLQQSSADLPEREFAQDSQGATTSSTPRNATAHTTMAKAPAPWMPSVEVAANHGSDPVVCSSAIFSTDAANFFLDNASHPSKKEAMAKIWAKLDLNYALLHEGSALHQDENGKWAVIGPLREEPAESAVQVLKPVQRIATPL